MKSPSRRALSLVAVLACAALGAPACGFGGDEDNKDAVSFLAPIYTDGENGTKALWDGIIKDFEAKNPDVDISLQMESWKTINKTVQDKIQSGSAPDILNIDAYAAYVKPEQLIYEAKDVVSEGVLRDFQPDFARNASIDGKQFGLPIFASTRTLFYNQELFDKAGVAAPPKTWDELLTAAKKINDLGGVSGYGLPLGSEEAQGETSIWTFGAGGSWGDDQTLTIDTPANLEGVTAMQRMIDEKATQPNPGATDRKDVINAFIQGKVGMIEGLPPTVAQLAKENPGLKYGTAPTPSKTGVPVTLGVADHLMSFKGDPAKQEKIRKFLDYFYSPDVYAKFVGTEGFIPTTISGAEKLAGDPVTKTFVATLPTAKFYPSNNPKWGAAQGALQQLAGTIDQGASPAEVLTKVQDAAK